MKFKRGFSVRRLLAYGVADEAAAVTAEHLMLLLPFGEVHQQQVQIFNLSKNIAHIYCLCLPKVIMHREERLRVLERDLTSLCIAEERTPTTTEGTLPPIQGGVEARAIVEKMLV